MNSTVKQESVFQCLKHGQKVIQIVLDNNYLPDDRMVCLECIELSRQPYNRVIDVAQANEMIKERILQQNAQMKEKSQPYLTKLTSLQQKLLTFIESQIKIIDNMIEFIQKWILEINNNMNTNEQIELQKGIELLLKDQKEFNIQLEQNGKAYLTKLQSLFDKLLKMEGIQECKQELLNLPLNNDQIKLKEEVDVKNITQLNQQILTQQQVVNKNEGIIAFKQINQVKQEQFCGAISFNKNGNIMIAGFNGNIKVWQFDNGNIRQFVRKHIFCEPLKQTQIIVNYSLINLQLKLFIELVIQLIIKQILLGKGYFRIQNELLCEILMFGLVRLMRSINAQITFQQSYLQRDLKFQKIGQLIIRGSDIYFRKIIKKIC